MKSARTKRGKSDDRSRTKFDRELPKGIPASRLYIPDWLKVVCGVTLALWGILTYVIDDSEEKLLFQIENVRKGVERVDGALRGDLKVIRDDVGSLKEDFHTMTIDVNNLSNDVESLTEIHEPDHHAKRSGNTHVSQNSTGSQGAGGRQ